MAALAKAGGDDGAPAALLGNLWEALDASARARLEEQLSALAERPDAAQEAVALAGLGAVTGENATVRPSSAHLQGRPSEPPAHERYEVRREHARGGMGRILIAWDPRLGREVALKELIGADSGDSSTHAASPPRLSALDGGERERFLREARVTGQLEHPNVVPVYELGEREGTPYYAMKLVRGESMADRLRRIARNRPGADEGLPERLRLLDAFVDVCDAMAYAHARGVINRDLKPANVMLGDFGETFVLDWGLARVSGQADEARKDFVKVTATLSSGNAKGSSKLTLDGSVIGTPAYMPPEQARGELDAVDERSDVYSLGAMLYELLTGHAPFEGPNVALVIQAVAKMPVEPPSTLAPSAPRDLSAIAMKALAKEKKDRYESARALADEVRAYRDGRPISVYRYTGVEQLRRFVRRNRALAASMALSGALLVLGIAVSTYWGRQASNESKVARGAEAEARHAQAAAASAAEDERRAHAATHDALRRAEGQRLAATALTVATDEPAVALLLAIEAAERAPGPASNNAILSALPHLVERRRLFGHHHYVRCGAFSPGGSRVATGSDDQVVNLWDPESGALLRSFPGHLASVQAVAFSPDGTRLLSTAMDGTARVWDVETGAAVARLGEARPEACRASFDPRGARVLTWAPDAAIWSLPGGERLELEGLAGAARVAAWSPQGDRVAVVYGEWNAGIWNAMTGRRERDPWEAGGAIHAVAFSPDGKSVLAGGADGVARAWTMDAGGAPWLRLAPPDPEPLVAVQFDREGAQVAAWDERRRLRIWSVASGACVAGPVSCDPGSLSPDWRRALRRDEHQAWVVDVASGERVATLRGHEYTVAGIAFDPAGRRVLTASSDRTVGIWNVEPGAALPFLTAPAGFRLAGIDAPRGRFLAVPVGGGMARWHSLTDASYIADFRQAAKGARFAHAGGNSEIAVWSSDGSFVVDLLTDEVTPWPEDVKSRVMWGGDGALAVIGSPEDCVYDFRARRRLPGVVPDGWTCAVPMPDGASVFLMNREHGISELLDLSTGKASLRFSKHTGTVIQGFLLPRLGAAVTTAADATVKKWDLATGKPLEVHQLPRIGEGSISRSSDERFIALRFAGVTRVLASRDMREVFTTPDSGARQVAFTPDSGALLLVLEDGIRVIPLDLVGLARKCAPRDFIPRELARFELGGPEERRLRSDAWSAAHPSGLHEHIKVLMALEDDRLSEARASADLMTRLQPTYFEAWRLRALVRCAEAKLLEGGAREAELAAAVADLGRAIRTGFIERDELEKAAEWESLRGRADFAEILKAAR
jgi:serine/threonine protein kinase/WD40 repeat protein